MIHNAKDLSADQKLLIENLLGRRVLEDETISVRAFEPSAVSDERRQEVAVELAKYFAEVDAHRLPVSDNDAAQILTEAIQSTRSGYRQHR